MNREVPEDCDALKGSDDPSLRAAAKAARSPLDVLSARERRRIRRDPGAVRAELLRDSRTLRAELKALRTVLTK